MVNIFVSKWLRTKGNALSYRSIWYNLTQTNHRGGIMKLRFINTFIWLGMVLLGLSGSVYGQANATTTLGEKETGEWLLVKTEHFTVLSNTDPERAKLIAFKLEQYRYVFNQLAPQLVAKLPVPARV